MNPCTDRLKKRINQTSVSPDAVPSHMETTRFFFYCFKPSAGTTSFHFSEHSLCSALTFDPCVEGEGRITHHHFAQVEPDVWAPCPHPEVETKGCFRKMKSQQERFPLHICKHDKRNNNHLLAFKPVSACWRLKETNRDEFPGNVGHHTCCRQFLYMSLGLWLFTHQIFV